MKSGFYLVKPVGLRLGIAWLPDHKQLLCGQPYWAREGEGKISKCKVQIAKFDQNETSLRHHWHLCGQSFSKRIIYVVRNNRLNRRKV